MVTSTFSTVSITNYRCRFLRNKDREMNHDKYPHLTFPELYILDGGYKAFYETYEVCCIIVKNMISVSSVLVVQFFM